MKKGAPEGAPPYVRFLEKRRFWGIGAGVLLPDLFSHLQQVLAQNTTVGGVKITLQGK